MKGSGGVDGDDVDVVSGGEFVEIDGDGVDVVLLRGCVETVFVDVAEGGDSDGEFVFGVVGL